MIKIVLHVFCSLALSLVAIHSLAQTAPLTLGSVTLTGSAFTCPGGFGWDVSDGMSCQAATVSCPSSTGGPVIQPWPLVFGVETPSNAVGTVVLFSGHGGTAPSEDSTDSQFAVDYYKFGYRVVQLAWGQYDANYQNWTPWDWELASNPIPPNVYGSILDSACRPATFLNYASTHLAVSGFGFCAQGKSAGSAALAYALTWFGAETWGQSGQPSGRPPDNVELLAGPLFSSVDQGCQVPTGNYVGVCPLGSPTWCKGWPTIGSQQVYVSPEYLSSAAPSVREWTNIQACANTYGKDTSTWNSIWNGESIITSSASSSQFSYPKTGMDAWLCANTAMGVQMNNSSPQGALFYDQVNNPTFNFTVNAIYGCPTNEGVEGGTDINNKMGQGQIEFAMETNCHTH